SQRLDAKQSEIRGAIAPVIRDARSCSVFRLVAQRRDYTYRSTQRPGLPSARSYASRESARSYREDVLHMVSLARYRSSRGRCVWVGPSASAMGAKDIVWV